MAVTIIVASFGDPKWVTLAEQRAIPSATRQGNVRTMHVDEPMHVGALRNLAVDSFDPQGWMCFLDPDDELADGYIAAMTAEPMNDNHLYVPALQLVRRGVRPPDAPQILNNRDIVNGLNPCPIGTLIHRSTFEDAGRFWDERAWEDWSLFRRAVLGGSTLRFVPDAVYRAYMSPDGRNSTVIKPAQLRSDILESHERWLHDRSARDH